MLDQSRKIEGKVSMPDQYLVTRINVPMSDPRSALKRHDADWIRYRFALMDRYAIPAIARQTETSFQWIWEVDPNTPLPVLETIENRAARVGAVVRFDRNWYPHRVIITTRFDSDDFLSAQFVRVVQDLARCDGRRPLAIDAPRGWKTDGKNVWTVNSPGSTFVSLVSDPHLEGDVWQCSHRDIIRRFPCVAATDRLWGVVIHGDNLLNRLRPTGPGLPL
jgi:hypothetical protein